MEVPKIKIVTIDNPYQNIDCREVRSLFGELVLLRSRGYGPEYHKNYLPLDDSDYISLHHLFCIEERGKLIPISGFKQVLLKRCDSYSVTLPLFRSAKAAGSMSHVQALETLFCKQRSESGELAYSSGFTIKRQYRGNKELSAFIYELLSALLYVDMKEKKITRAVTGAVLRFKTNEQFIKMGYQPMVHAGLPLVPLKKVAALGEPMLFMCLEKVTSWPQSCFEKHKDLIESRILYRKNEEEPLKEAA